MPIFKKLNMHKPEYRLKSRSRSDRSVNHKNYARTTDKGNQKVGDTVSSVDMTNETTVKNMIAGLNISPLIEELIMNNNSNHGQYPAVDKTVPPLNNAVERLTRVTRTVKYTVPSATITNEIAVKKNALVFTNFDRDALFDVMNKKYGISMQYYRKRFDLPAAGRSIELENSLLNQSLVYQTTANYPDQVPPFNVTITAGNEYGQSMMMGLFGVELLNQGQGISVDDMVTETQFTFVCRGLVGWKPQSKDNDTIGSGKSSLEDQMRKTEAYKSAELAYNLA